MSLLEGLAAYLDAAGIGTYRSDGTAYADAETGIFLEFQAETPDSAVTLTSYPGGVSDSKLGQDSLRFQAKTRAVGQNAARALCQQVYDELQGLGPVTLPDGTRMTLCFGLNGGPYYLRRDDSLRSEFVTNFQVDINNVSPHRT